VQPLGLGNQERSLAEINLVVKGTISLNEIRSSDSLLKRSSCPKLGIFQSRESKFTSRKTQGRKCCTPRVYVDPQTFDKMSLDNQCQEELEVSMRHGNTKPTPCIL